MSQLRTALTTKLTTKGPVPTPLLEGVDSRGFLLEINKLYEDARSRGQTFRDESGNSRPYLEFSEWRQYAAAAIRHGYFKNESHLSRLVADPQAPTQQQNGLKASMLRTLQNVDRALKQGRPALSIVQQSMAVFPERNGQRQNVSPLRQRH